jgi:protein arginine phosphatase
MGLFRKKFTITFVCKANITRSAYLHGYMEHMLKEYYPYALKKIAVRSGGVKARGGGSAHQVVQNVARINGFSLRNHLSSKMTTKLVKESDVILVMEQWQKEELIERFPKAADKVFRLTEYKQAGDPKEIQDVPDPTGQNTKDYEAFIETAHAEIDRIIRELGRDGIL